MSFNLSNPAAKKTNEKKVPWYEKIWAGINLIALFGDGFIPKGAKDNIPIKVRNIIILIFIVILLYFLGSGIWYNAMMIIEYSRNVSFQLGDSFYYYGIIAIISVFIDYFDLDTAVSKKYADKKMMKSMANDLLKNPNKLLDKSVQHAKTTAMITGFIGLINGLWTIWGIIFYDRWYFVSLIAISFASHIACYPLKQVKHVKAVLISEMILTIILILVILNNHFLFFTI